MKTINRREIEVYAHCVGMSEPNLMGVFFATPGRGKETFSFEYNKDWLKKAQAHVLDPSLALWGIQYPPRMQQNFNIFLDSSPDRWGQG